jgi:hypothetical protein
MISVGYDRLQGNRSFDQAAGHGLRIAPALAAAGPRASWSGVVKSTAYKGRKNQLKFGRHGLEKSAQIINFNLLLIPAENFKLWKID